MKHQDTVVMPKKSFIKEHKNLIKLLEKPTKNRLAKEAKAQKKELMDVIKKR